MFTREQKIRVGVFFFIGILLIGVLFYVSYGQKLFEDSKTYRIRFENTSVSGLEVGSNVKYHGIIVGKIDEIRVSKKDIRNIIVSISVNEETPIKEDMEANVVMMGITGMKQIELSGGSNESNDLPEGSFIETGTSAIADITGDAQVIADKVELLVNNLNNFTRIENQQAFSDILVSLDYLLEENSEQITRTIDNADTAVRTLKNTANDLRTSASNIKELTEHEKIERVMDSMLAATESTQTLVDDLRSSLRPERLNNITGNIEEFTKMMKDTDTTRIMNETQSVLSDLRTILKQTDETSQTIDMTVLKSSRDLVETIESLNNTMKNLNEFSRIISEDPSRLIEF